LRGGDVVILGGGMPVTAEGVVVGAIGISSGTVHQDAEIAKQAVQEFEALAGQAKPVGSA
ncbi:MAG: heme-binding protein, partial [Rhizobiaceae bacterium]